MGPRPIDVRLRSVNERIDRLVGLPPSREFAVMKIDTGLDRPVISIEEAAISVWPKDVLRHSFASYGFHYQGVEWVIETLGHTNPTMLFKR